jgi:HPt (histidine-containing phosphotransfer) domain-containing protein
MSSAASQPVDLVHLARYTGGDRALNTEVLQLFVGQAGEMTQQLKAVVESHDAKTWRHITHSLKGAARGIGAFAFANAAAEAEPLDLVRDTAAALSAVQTLITQAEAVQLFVQDYLAS